MIKTYDSNVRGKTKVFFVIDKDGKVISRIVGNQAINVDMGFQFYVDDYVAEQIDRCELYMDGLTPKLRLREGETLDIPKKTERELEIERLKYELEKLQNEDEEESTD